MNPYITDAERIPPSDKFADLPLYGRYQPKPDDFRIDRQHVNSHSTESLHYWASVLTLCNDSVLIYPGVDGGRAVFALGSIIIKSGHLYTQQGTKEIDYTYSDANELQAIAIAKTVLKDVRVPEIYFAEKVLILTMSYADIMYSPPLRSTATRYWSRKDFQVLHWQLPGLIFRKLN